MNNTTHPEPFECDHFVQRDGKQVHLALTPEQTKAAADIKVGDEFDIEAMTGEDAGCVWWLRLDKRLEFGCGKSVIIGTPQWGGAVGEPE